MMMLHALKYANDGFAVFPVYEPVDVGICSCPYGAAAMIGDRRHSIGKHPRTPNGVDDATTDTVILKEWWTKWPNASIGMATGSLNGIAVVDLDGPEGILFGRLKNISSPITSLTGSGQHLLYADPAGQARNSIKKIAPNVDIRGRGGYIIVAPSLHPNGKRYVWAGQPPNRKLLPPIPALFVDQPITHGNSITGATLPGLRKPEGWIAAALEEMKRGHVHNTLISILGKFRIHNFSEEDTFKLLEPYALLDGKPYEGLRNKISEIWRRYQPGMALSGPEKSETIDAFLEDIKEVEWICKPFVAKKSIGFVVGLPATLKTWLCADLAVECARDDGMWLGLFPVTSCKVLFIDQERWKGETQRRFSAILAGKGLAHSQLKDSLYVKSGTTIRLNLDQSYQAFRTELMEMRPELVIVDSFATFHTLPENDRTEIQKVLERIKELRNEIGCTFMFINHENKSAYPNGEPQGEPTMGTMVGSIGIGAAAEFCLTVRKVDDNTSLIWHTKATQSQTAKAFYVSVVDVPEGVVVRGLND
jgi:hypothetical protein